MRKLSQILLFCGYSLKFSPQNLGYGVLWYGKSDNLRKFSLRKSDFHQFAKVISIETFPLYSTCLYYTRQLLVHICVSFLEEGSGGTQPISLAV